MDDVGAHAEGRPVRGGYILCDGRVLWDLPMRIRRTARKAIADYVTGLSAIRARAGDHGEIAHLQDRAEMPREKHPQPPTLIRPQDLHTAAAIRPEILTPSDDENLLLSLKPD